MVSKTFLQIVAILIIITIVTVSLVWIYSQHHYTITESVKAEIWKDQKTKETVFNKTVTFIVRDVYVWKSEIIATLTYSFEIFRSNNTSLVIQKAIDWASYIQFHGGVYNLSNSTIIDKEK